MFGSVGHLFFVSCYFRPPVLKEILWSFPENVDILEHLRLLETSCCYYKILSSYYFSFMQKIRVMLSVHTLLCGIRDVLTRSKFFSLFLVKRSNFETEYP